MTLLFVLLSLLWIAALVGARVMERDASQRLDAPETQRAFAPLAGVDVVVPARNEEANISALLESLLVQDHPPASIVVVDDQSTDGTAAVVAGFTARDPRVRRVAGRGPPPGWHGKPAALVEGFAATTAPWILFVDADVRLHPANLRCAMRETDRREWAGISLWGTWIVPDAPARWLQSVVGGFIRGAHPLAAVNDPEKPDAFLNGQYLLIRREAYDAVGGWGAVKGAFGMEDVALARLAKSKKIAIGLLRAPDLMSVHPYRSIGEVWRGYLKNFVEGAGGTARALSAAAVIFLAAVLPALVVIFALLLAAVRLLQSGTTGEHSTMIAAAVLGDPRTLAATFCVAAAMVFRWNTHRLFHHPRADAFSQPLANAIFVALIVYAVWLKSRGRGAEWKGRPA